MAELFVWVCLLATPEKCQQFKVPGASTPDVVTRIRQGGDKSNEWQEQNSQYVVMGWNCVMNKDAQ